MMEFHHGRLKEIHSELREWRPCRWFETIWHAWEPARRSTRLKDHLPKEEVSDGQKGEMGSKSQMAFCTTGNNSDFSPERHEKPLQSFRLWKNS